ncbi:MAG: hypothetical protein LBE27_08080 [Deltaproteobacteria bacterium]|jgi:hypothetical protein|nr:hypothetical protein [Deltaproteobacteria bacterium]
MPVNVPLKKISTLFSLFSVVMLVIFTSCAPKYEYKAIPVRAMSAYPGQASGPGVQAGAVAFYDSSELKELFGFDLKKAGVVPVQVSLKNTGTKALSIEPGSTLVDSQGNTWELLPSSVVFDRIDKYTSGGLSMDEGAKRTALWGLAGAVVGAAVGVVSGTNVGSAAGKGAAAGAAAGASSAILGLGNQDDTADAVVRDFSSRSIQQSTIQPGDEAHGFLYFPAESKEPRTLNLKVSEGASPQTLKLDL